MTHDRLQTINRLLASLLLAFAVFMQSMVMAKAGLPAITPKLDAYGSVICGSETVGGGAEHQSAPACCLSGCILTAAGTHFNPPDLFLSLHMRSSEALPLMQAVSSPHLVYRLSHEARAPPNPMMFSPF